MGITNSVDFDALEKIARTRDAAIGQERDQGRRSIRRVVPGKFDSPPRLARGRVSQREIAARGYKGTTDSEPAERFECLVRGIAFRDRTQVKSHAALEQARGVIFLVQDEILEAYFVARIFKAYGIRKSFFAPSFAPQTDTGANRHVKRPTGLPRELLRNGKDIPKIITDFYFR